MRGSGTEDAEGTKTGLIHRKTVKRFALLVSHRASVCVEFADRMSSRPMHDAPFKAISMIMVQ